VTATRVASAGVALVSGGLGAIGQAVCRALGERGHVVGACDIAVDDARRNAFALAMGGIEAHAEQCDVADFDACVALVERIEATRGPIAVLVNNAGITRDATLRKMTREQWDQVRAVNYDSVFNLTQPLVGRMCDRGYGRIVNIASIVGQTGAFGQSNYAASKAATHGFTMALAREVAGKGVTVNSVSPGYVRSAMTDAIPDAVRERILASVPAGRIGEPEDIARAVAFLCEPGASYLTGIDLPVNGGLFISS
jgi:acetoacetyl-CoA reductase